MSTDEIFVFLGFMGLTLLVIGIFNPPEAWLKRVFQAETKNR